MGQKPEIHIVDDDEAIRKSLTMLIQSIDMEAKSYASAEEFLGNFSPAPQCCVLMDVRMPGMSGLELQALLPKKNINVPVVMMTGYGDIPTAVNAMKAGAVDFVEKPFDHDLLIRTIRRCIETTTFQFTVEEKQKFTQQLSVLTSREREVFDQLVEGKINKVIAAELNLSVRTVEAHRANIMDKLKVHSLPELVKISIYSKCK